MSWVKIDDQFPQHPKLLEAGPLGLSLFVAGLCYCSRYLTDGFIPRQAVSTLLDFDGVDTGGAYEANAKQNASKSEAIAFTLVEVGLWETTDRGYQVHDYLDYNPTRSRVLSTREVRANAGSTGGLRSGESRREAKAKQIAASLDGVSLKQNRSKNEPRTRTPSPLRESSLNPNIEIKQTSAADAATALAELALDDEEENEDDPLPELFLTAPSNNGATQRRAAVGAPARERPTAAAGMPAPPEKPSGYTEDFEQFWAAYPRRYGTARGSKADAFAVWKRMKVGERSAATAGARSYALTDDARREHGKYIPDAVRWLKGKRWEVVADSEHADHDNPHVPPDWASWERDEHGDWIPLEGDPDTGLLPYGATDSREVKQRHRERSIEEFTRMKGATQHTNGHRPNANNGNNGTGGLRV